MTLSADTLGVWLDELLGECRVPGAAAAVWHRGRVVEASAGIAHIVTGAPVRPDTVFQIGSTSKPFTATLVMQLVDEGLVDLDVPVVKYLPELDLGDDEATHTVTCRQLLTHTSGIQGDMFEDLGEDDDAPRRLVEACARYPMHHPPGERHSYCNTGYVILGRLVETLRGGQFEAVERERLFDLAGLRDIVTSPAEAIMRSSAIGHFETAEGPVPAPRWALPRSLGPSGTVICASAATLLQFAIAHHEAATGASSAVLSAASALAMQQPEIAVPEGIVGSATGWGLGWILYRWPDANIIGHDGGAMAQGSALRYSPEHELAVSVLHNGGNGGRLAETIVRRVFGELAGATPPPDPAPDAHLVIDPSTYVGRYSRLNHDLDITLGENGLELTSRFSGALATWNTVSTIPVVAAAPHLLLAGSPGSYQRLGFFEPDADGRPQWMYTGFRSARRQPLP